MKELHPVYLYPEFDSNAGLNMAVSAEDVELALREHPRIPGSGNGIPYL